MGTREIGYLFGQYRRLTSQYEVRLHSGNLFECFMVNSLTVSFLAAPNYMKCARGLHGERGDNL